MSQGKVRGHRNFLSGPWVGLPLEMSFVVNFEKSVLIITVVIKDLLLLLVVGAAERLLFVGIFVEVVDPAHVVFQGYLKLDILPADASHGLFVAIQKVIFSLTT